MLVWFDSNTTKHAIFFSVIGKKLSEKGYKVIHTVRRYDAIISVMKRLNEKPYIVGEYGGKTLMGKLKASVEKTINILKLFEEEDIKPGVSIHYASPEAARIAYGVGMTSIAFDDSPHSIPPLKLAVVLSNFLLTSKVFPKELFSNYIPESKIIQYYSIDEVEWVTFISPDLTVMKKLGLENENYIIFRPEEAFASYYLEYSSGKPLAMGEKIFKWILRNFKQYKILVLPRYIEQAAVLREIGGDNVIIPEEPILTIDVLPKAKMVITGGGTMAKEAALLGIPTLTYFPGMMYPESFLEMEGFPIRHYSNLEKAKEYIKMVLRDPDEYFTETDIMIKQFEMPSDVLMKLLEKEKVE
ncbi:MAG: DUF354 domain-containing protein [Candidatus Njordarchaeia archaeon]